MRRWIGIAVVLVVVATAGCKKESSDSDGPERDGKALWKLAPAGTTGGVVIAAGTGPELHRGFIAVVDSIRKHPAGAKLVSEMLAEASSEGVDPLSPDGFKVLGVDTSKAAALFLVGDEPYGIVPIGDRQAFRARIKATEKDGVDIAEGESACKVDGDHYLCARSLEKLEAWKPAGDSINQGWPTALRGSIEFYVAGSVLEGAEPIEAIMEKAGALHGSVRIERGAALVRVSVAGEVKQMLQVGETPLADAAKASNPAALATGYARAFVDFIRADMGSKIDEPGPGGVTPGKIFSALTGEVVAFAPAGGAPRGFIEIGIRDAAPFKALTPLCGMAPPLGPGVSIKSTQDGCAATFGPPASPLPFDIAVAITDKAIVAKLGAAAEGRDGAGGPPLPSFYTSKRWLGSMWLRGSILAATEALQAPQMTQLLQQTPEIGLGLWAYGHLSELGFGMRTDGDGVHGFLRIATTWRNPEPVVDALEPLIGRFASGDLAVGGDVKALAGKHGGSPLAADMKLGVSGGSAGAAGIGVLAAIAIPAFQKYQRKARDAGAELAAAQFQQLRLQMCACRDKACAEQISAELEQWRAGLGDLERQLEARSDMREAAQSFTECMSKAMAAP